MEIGVENVSEEEKRPCFAFPVLGLNGNFPVDGRRIIEPAGVEELARRSESRTIGREGRPPGEEDRKQRDEYKTGAGFQFSTRASWSNPPGLQGARLKGLHQELRGEGDAIFRDEKAI
jgi:hypothetical protein